MSFIDNARRAFSGKDEDYDREYDDEMYEEEEEEKRPKFFSFLKRNKDEYDDYVEEEEAAERRYSRAESARYNERSRSSSESIRYGSSRNDDEKIEVIVMHPTSFDESARLVKLVKEGKITIFDVSEIESSDEARRIVDYICGAAEGLDCPFSRLCPSIFCIAPKGVTLTDQKRRY